MEWPTMVQMRAKYSRPKARTAAISMAVNSAPNLASISGSEAKIIASTSRTMMATISRTKREPTEYGR